MKKKRKKYAIGIDIGGTKISIVLVSEEGKVLFKKKLKTRLRKEVNVCLKEMTDVIRKIIHRAKANKRNVTGIGIGIPGPVGMKKGTIENAPNLPGWNGFHIQGYFEKRFKCPIIVNNDANASCLAEKKYGLGKRAGIFLYITVSTGIGAGLIIDNSLIMGSNNNAGEIGHIVVEHSGVKCGCGKKDCLEAYASGTAIASFYKRIKTGKIAKALFENELAFGEYKKHVNAKFSFKKMINKKCTQNITAYDIVKKAQRNEELAKYAYWRAGYYFGVGLANVLQILNPAVIALGGSVLKAGTLYTNAMKIALKENAWKNVRKTCIIKKAILGDTIADIGAASLVFHNNE